MKVNGIKFVRVARHEYESENGLSLTRDDVGVWICEGDCDDETGAGNTPAEALEDFVSQNGEI